MLNDNLGFGQGDTVWGISDDKHNRTVCTSAVDVSQPGNSVLSVNNDCDLSSNQRTRGPGAGLQTNHRPEEHTQIPFAGNNMEDEHPPLELLSTEHLVAGDGDTRHLDAAFCFNGGTASAERETDILDDEDGHVPEDTATTVPDSEETGHRLPALASLACEESHQYSAVQAEDIGEGEWPASSGVTHGANAARFLAHTQVVSGAQQTHMWVRQHQLVSSDLYRQIQSDGLERREEVELESGRSNSMLPATCSPEAKVEAEKDDEFASLALDIDQSIEQLNQLILDLDPEFEPVPTRVRSQINRSASLHTNGIGHSAAHAKPKHADWSQRQPSDVMTPSAFMFPTHEVSYMLPTCATYTPPKCGGVYQSDTVDYGEFTPEGKRPLWVDLPLPQTPAFPVSPPTPYGKSVYDFSPMSYSPVPYSDHPHSRTEHGKLQSPTLTYSLPY